MVRAYLNNKSTKKQDQTNRNSSPASSQTCGRPSTTSPSRPRTSHQLACSTCRYFDTDLTASHSSTPPADDEELMTNGADSGPGLDFVMTVENRCGAISSNENPSPHVPHGRANQQLLRDFVDGHPYFSTQSFRPQDNDLYREKVAFYLVKNGVSRGISEADIVATAVGIVIECKRRRQRQGLIHALYDARAAHDAAREFEDAALLAQDLSDASLEV